MPGTIPEAPESVVAEADRAVRFPRRTTYCMVMALVLLTVLFRYPLSVGHELGSDTTFIHSLSDSLLRDGLAAWTLHPTSYFGLYALSYPSAGPFLIASVSAAGDIPIEGAILLVGLAFAVTGTLGGFLAARAAKDDDRIAFIVALLFSTAPFFVKDTTWIGSTRGFVTALVPVVILLLLRHLRSHDLRYAGICLLLVGAMATIHRMGMLALLILIAYLFAVPFHRLTQRLRFALTRYESRFRLTSAGASVAGFFVVFYLQFLFPGTAGANVVQQYGTGTLFQGSSFPVLVVNMAVSLTGKVGLLLPLGLIGLVRYAWLRPKEGRDKFLLVVVFVIIPLLSLRDYIAEFLVYIFVLLVALSVIPRPKVLAKRKVLTLSLVALLMVSTVAFSWVMKDYWRNRYYTDGQVPDELYGVGVYAHWEADGTILSNEGLSAGRLTAISGRPTLPIGGASNHWFGPQQLTFGFVTEDGVFVEPIPITGITFHTDAIYVPVGVPNAKDDYETIFYNSMGTLVQRLLARYDVHYLLLDKGHPTEFQSYVWRNSPLARDVQRDAYNVFETPGYSLYYVG